MRFLGMNDNLKNTLQFGLRSMRYGEAKPGNNLQLEIRNPTSKVLTNKQITKTRLLVNIREGIARNKATIQSFPFTRMNKLSFTD